MSKIKVCEKCRNKIRPKIEDFYQIDTYEKGKKVKEAYMHKKCNEEMEKQKEMTQNLMSTVVKSAKLLENEIKKIRGDENEVFVLQ